MSKTPTAHSSQQQSPQNSVHVPTSGQGSEETALPSGIAAAVEALSNRIQHNATTTSTSTAAGTDGSMLGVSPVKKVHHKKQASKTSNNEHRTRPRETHTVSSPQPAATNTGDHWGGLLATNLGKTWLEDLRRMNASSQGRYVEEHTVDLEAAPKTKNLPRMQHEQRVMMYHHPHEDHHAPPAVPNMPGGDSGHHTSSTTTTEGSSANAISDCPDVLPMDPHDVRGGTETHKCLRAALTKIRGLEVEVSKLKSQLRDAEAEAEAAERKQKQELSRSRLEAESVDLKAAAKRSSLEEDLADSKTQLATMKRELDMARHAADENQKQLVKTTEQLEEARGRFHEEAVVLDKQHHLQRSIDDLERTLMEVKEERDRHHKESRSLRQEVKSSKAHLKAKEALLQDLQESLRTLSTRHVAVVKEHEDALENAHKQLQLAKNRKDAARGANEEELHSMLQTANMESNKLRKRLYEVSEQYDAQSAAMKEQAGQLKEQEALVGKWRRRHNNAAEQLVRTEERLRDAQKWEHEYIAVAGRLGAAQARNDHLEQQLRVAKGLAKPTIAYPPAAVSTAMTGDEDNVPPAVDKAEHSVSRASATPSAATLTAQQANLQRVLDSFDPPKQHQHRPNRGPAASAHNVSNVSAASSVVGRYHNTSLRSQQDNTLYHRQHLSNPLPIPVPHEQRHHVATTHRPASSKRSSTNVSFVDEEEDGGMDHGHHPLHRRATPNASSFSRSTAAPTATTPSSISTVENDDTESNKSGLLLDEHAHDSSSALDASTATAASTAASSQLDRHLAHLQRLNHQMSSTMSSMVQDHEEEEEKQSDGE